ncbi:unnamed protein product [Bemisia tabaci]|uniref:Major facilitator superfamily (MFS) profile domain-containing protein n=1 Tax=Bemisia tabaci TaxID=7038 RepID=A0A9P0CFZ4_BEMTA|nr:unnamed protein product [Bemisia tabaci]
MTATEKSNGVAEKTNPEAETQVSSPNTPVEAPPPPDDPVDLVNQATGNFGKWQFWICLAISLSKLPVAWHQLSIIFLSPKLHYFCSEGHSNFTSPSTASTRAACWTSVNGTRTRCHHWTYDTSVFHNTITTEWDLVCERSQLSNVAQSTFMFGVLLGNVLFGMAADSMGRKTPLLWGIILQVVAGIGTAFAPWYELFLPLRFITALAVGGTMTTSFVLCMEIVGGKWRTIVSTLYHIPFNIGHMTLPLFAYYTRDWRAFQLGISIPSILLLSYYCCVPESPRWLLAMGKEKQAMKVLNRAAKRNKKELPEDYQQSIAASQKSRTLSESDSDKRKPNIIDLFRTPNMRIKTLALYVNWATCGLVFYGLAQYMGEIGGNIFINVALSGITGPVGVLSSYFFLSYYGRVKTMSYSLIATSIALLCLSAVPQPDPEASSLPKIILAYVGIIGVSVAFPTIYLLTGELFPTVVRNVGVGSSSMMSRLGSMAAPFVLSLGAINVHLPPIIFGLLPMFSAACCLALPETRGAELPQTMEDGENFGKKQRSDTKSGVPNAAFTSEENDTSSKAI